MTDEEYLKLIYTDIICDFSNLEDCNRLKEMNKDMVFNEKPMFSFMMCVYNDTHLLNAAINSLLRQSFTQWELIILDNSDRNEHAWEMIENAMYADRRIKGYRSSQNVGWPKGASICMEHISGEYTTFLAADDCINIDALSQMSSILSKENPDILWVGNAYVNYENETSIALTGITAPQEYKIFEEEKRSPAIVKIMKTIYYNSFFHYMKVSFLKANNIDFFEPYYADCAGMTKSMSVAHKMITYNQVVYFLTTNTSQTAGTYSWDSYEYIFASQWRSIKDVFCREKYNNLEDIQYAAIRILNNLFANIGLLCRGKCRDKYMKPIEKSFEEIINQLEKIFCQKDILDMLIIAGIPWISTLLQNMRYLKDWAIEYDSTLIQHSPIKLLLTASMHTDELCINDIIKIYSMLIIARNNL